MPTHGSIFKFDDALQFARERGLDSEVARIYAMRVRPGMPGGRRVRKGYIVQLFEERELMNDFVAAYWPGRHTESGARRYARLLELVAMHEGSASQPARSPGVDPESSAQHFALEADLRNYLARNLHVIEGGLTLYDKDGRKGIEFTVDGGRIDILAVDSGGTPVVLELKLSRGRSSVIGQILYFMGWVDEHLGLGRSRGIIVARDIPEDLVTATS